MQYFLYIRGEALKKRRMMEKPSKKSQLTVGDWGNGVVSFEKSLKGTIQEGVSRFYDYSGNLSRTEYYKNGMTFGQQKQ